MKFYDTFQKAKEENPNSDIVTTGPKWIEIVRKTNYKIK